MDREDGKQSNKALIAHLAEIIANCDLLELWPNAHTSSGDRLGTISRLAHQCIALVNEDSCRHQSG